MRRFPLFLFALSFALSFALPFCLPLTARAAETTTYLLTLENGKFAPADLALPAHKKIKLIVKNADAMPAEFESAELDREQVVAAHDSITVYLGPLDPGVYPYFNDFNRKASGKIKVQ